MRWLIQIADRTHALAIPGVWVLLSVSYYALAVALTPEPTCCWDSQARLWGTFVLYSLTPAFLLAGVVILWRGNQAALAELEGVLGREEIAEARFSASGGAVAVAVLLGLVFALGQFGSLLFSPENLVNPWVDLSMMGGNVLVWTIVGWFSVIRARAAWTFRKLGASVQVDLYDPDSCKPFATVAIREVLMIMAVLALMPLQSLDAEFRLDNYIFGVGFGLPMAGLVFYLYLSGIHQAMLKAKRQRLGELQDEIARRDRGDVAGLEALVAHRERIRHLAPWPLDVSLLSRVVFYLIIPPAAWVGAALVETLVQGFID